MDLYRQGHFSQAAAEFEHAAVAAPQRPVYAYHLGIAHVRGGHAKAGLTALRRALNLGLAGADAAIARAVIAGDLARLPS